MRLLQKNGVFFYQSELLPCPHGFATRIGGVSTIAHTTSLNLAFGRGDDEDIVLENLARFAKAVGISPKSVVSLPQVHGNEILNVSRADAGDGYYFHSGRTADGYYTEDVGVTLGVKTADCVPILLCGCSESGEVKAVSALHAGWRGTHLKIAERGVRALVARGIRTDRIFAAIGPSIGRCCYEVGEELREAFRSAFGDDFVCETFFAKPEAKYTTDLKEINRRLLIEAGLHPEHIDVSDMCTACHPDLFFSHRYSHGVRGTMLSVISVASGGI